MQSLHCLLPPYADRATGTFGKIDRGNSWWVAKYKQFTNSDITLVDDMRNLYNTVSNNQTPPNFLLTTQTLFELYEQYGLEQSQIVKDATGSQMVDLGFDVLRFKGKPMVWSPNVTSGDIMMFNLNKVEVVYDPAMYFDITEWKAIPNSTERLCHMLIALNILTDEPRRHGLLYT